MAADNALTTFRKAVWNAVDNHCELRDRFKQKLRFEIRSESTRQKDPMPRLAGPLNRAQLPAIAIYPARAVPSWYTNQALILPYTLTVDVWTLGWVPDTVEDIWDDFIDAIYNQAPESNPTVPYVRAACRNFSLEPVTVRFGRLKQETKVQITQATFGITGHFAKTPKQGV